MLCLEGMEMNAQQLWQTFLETGSPEVYLLYNQAKRVEQNHVFDSSGAGPAGHSLQ